MSSIAQVEASGADGSPPPPVCGSARYWAPMFKRPSSKAPLASSGAVVEIKGAELARDRFVLVRMKEEFVAERDIGDGQHLPQGQSVEQRDVGAKRGAEARHSRSALGEAHLLALQRTESLKNEVAKCRGGWMGQQWIVGKIDVQRERDRVPAAGRPPGLCDGMVVTGPNVKSL